MFSLNPSWAQLFVANASKVRVRKFLPSSGGLALMFEIEDSNDSHLSFAIHLDPNVELIDINLSKVGNDYVSILQAKQQTVPIPSGDPPEACDEDSMPY